MLNIVFLLLYLCKYYFPWPKLCNMITFPFFYPQLLSPRVLIISPTFLLLSLTLLSLILCFPIPQTHPSHWPSCKALHTAHCQPSTSATCQLYFLHGKSVLSHLSSCSMQDLLFLRLLYSCCLGTFLSPMLGFLIEHNGSFVLENKNGFYQKFISIMIDGHEEGSRPRRWLLRACFIRRNEAYTKFIVETTNAPLHSKPNILCFQYYCICVSIWFIQVYFSLILPYNFSSISLMLSIHLPSHRLLNYFCDQVNLFTNTSRLWYIFYTLSNF